MSNFITEIKIKKVRHLENIDIVLGNEKKHLILTGKNGCGKTSVLEELNKFFLELFREPSSIKIFFNFKDRLDDLSLIVEKDFIDLVQKYNTCYPLFNIDSFYLKLKDEKNDFIYAIFRDKRSNQVNRPLGINKIDFLEDKTSKLNKDFLQFIVNLKAERSFAKDDEDMGVVQRIDDWFERFESMLKQIFSDDSLKIIFDRKNYNFIIHRNNREQFDFNGLSSGYSSIIDIFTEVILKIENTKSKSFDCEGVVLIDEVENHLHVELQKNILPLLTTFFPNIQFIVTTHSPFVLQSIENSVVYDLERKEQLSGEKLKNASYSDIVKNYFEVDSEFSKVLENDIVRYENLVQIFDEKKLNIEDEKELLELDIKLDKITPMLSDTIYLRFKESQDRISDNG